MMREQAAHTEVTVAIANQADAAALARSFADDLRDLPEAKRIWYWSKMGHHVPSVLSLDLFVLLSRSDDQIEAAVTEAMMRVHKRFPEMMLAVISFTEEEVAYYDGQYDVEDFLRDDSIEMPLRSA
jgi:hypothetical protein